MNYYNDIKEILINNEINKRVKEYSKNKVELESYYNVGKILFDAGKHYGEGIIKEYSIELNAVSDFLTWTHYRQLLSMKDINITW